MPNIGTNVEAKIDDDVLIIKVDLSKEGEPSKSGKSIVLGSTKGNKKIDHKGSEVVVGLNVYRKLED